MNAFTRSISQIFQGAVKAFQTFPAAIACALAFAIVTMVRIQLEWPQQEAYNFLFNCLHWSFALGTLFSLAAITAAQSRFNQTKAFLSANLLGVAAVAVTFLALYFFGGTHQDLSVSRYAVVSGLAAARVGAAMLVSFLIFIVLAGNPKEESDFARAFFMTHKALFIALIYGAVIMSGTSGVAGAVQSLLYREMSWKVYAYLGTIVGFLSFTIFVGYFPDFRQGQTDGKREAAQKQPRFIEILFEYIMIPIVLALTAVLLIWAGQTVLKGMGTKFFLISGIATSYALSGIWLHIMVTHSESALAKFYRWFYPITALVILAFEAWALLIQLSQAGLKMDEYYFALVWIIAAVASVLLLLVKDKAHLMIIVLTCGLAIFSVLPVVGYQDLPVNNQIGRLEKLLISQNMLKDNQLIPAAKEPEKAVRESITDAVTYLAAAEDAQLPVWFDKGLSNSGTFKTKLGFEQTWPAPDTAPGQGGYMSTSLVLPPTAIDISGYRWAAFPQQVYKDQATVFIDGSKGTYRINWTVNSSNNIPTLRIELDGRVILEQNMNAYLDRITASFPPGQTGTTEATVSDMSLKLETPEVTVLLLFSNIDINGDPQKDTLNYWLNLSALYLNEKP